MQILKLGAKMLILYYTVWKHCRGSSVVLVDTCREVITQHVIPHSVTGCLPGKVVFVWDEHLDWQLGTGLKPATEEPPPSSSSSLQNEEGPGRSSQVPLCRLQFNVAPWKDQSTHHSSSINKHWLCLTWGGEGSLGGGGVEEWMGGGGLDHRIDPGRKSLCFPWLSNVGFSEQSKWLRKQSLWMPGMFHNQTSFCRAPAQTGAGPEEQLTCTRLQAPRRLS